jgi:hypothetical protein
MLLETEVVEDAKLPSTAESASSNSTCGSASILDGESGPDDDLGELPGELFRDMTVFQMNIGKEEKQN